MRRLAVGSSRRWPPVGSEMGYTALGNALDSNPVSSHIGLEVLHRSLDADGHMRDPL